MLGDRPDTLTLAVLEGVKRAAGASSGSAGPLVELIVPDGGPKEFLEAEKDFPFVSVIRNPPSADTDAVNLRALARCEGIVLVGGGTGTKTAGLAASLMHKAVIPVGCFGGGAEKVWTAASADRDGFYVGALSDAEVDELYSSWNPATDPRMVVDFLERVRREIERHQTPSGVIMWTIVTLVLSLVAWGLALVTPTLVREVSNGERTTAPLTMVLLLALSACIAIAGASLKLLRDARSGVKITSSSANIVLALGFAVGVITTLVYMTAEISITGTLTLYKSEQDFPRVALVVSLGALLAGLYLDTALERLDAMRDTVMRGKDQADTNSPERP